MRVPTKYKNIYAFVDEPEDPKNIPHSKLFRIHQKAMKGNKLTRSEKDFIFHRINESTQSTTGIALMGYIYDFGSVLKRYIVKYDDGFVNELRAFDKTCIRNCSYTNSRISEIIEIPKRA